MQFMTYEELDAVVRRSADRIVEAAVKKYGDPDENGYCDAEFIFADPNGTKYYCLVTIPNHARMYNACCIFADGRTGAALDPGKVPEVTDADFAMMDYAGALDLTYDDRHEPKTIDLTIPDSRYEAWDPLAA